MTRLVAALFAAFFLVLVVPGDAAWAQSPLEQTQGEHQEKSLGEAAKNAAIKTITGIVGKVWAPFQIVGDAASDVVRSNLEDFVDVPKAITYCWSCHFATQFIVIGDGTARAVYALIARELSGILIYTFAIWLAIQAIKVFFGESGFAMLKSVALRSLAFMAVYGAATDTGMNMYLDWIYTPVLETSVDATKAIVEGTQVAIDGGGATLANIYGLNDPETSWARTAGRLHLGADSRIGHILPGLTTILESMQRITGYGYWAGFLIAVSPDFANFLWLVRIFAGGILQLIFGVAMIAFPFYVLDLFLRVFLITAVAPLAIAAFLYRPTRGTAIAALKGVVQSALVLMMLGIVYVFTGAMMAIVLGMVEEGAALRDFDAFIQWLWQNAGAQGFHFAHPAYWFLLCSGILAMGAASKARGIVGALIGGFDDGSSMGDKAATIAGTAGKAAAGAAMSLGGTLATGGIGLAVGAGMAKMGMFGQTAGVLKSGLRNAAASMMTGSVVKGSALHRMTVMGMGGGAAAPQQAAPAAPLVGGGAEGGAGSGETGGAETGGGDQP
jgi:hypothetical protein